MKTDKKGQTGPRSIKGKAKSSMNALKHGAYSKAVVLPSEDAHDYERKVRAYQRSLKITSELGKDLARLTVDHYWVAQRMKTQLSITQKKYYPSIDAIKFAKYLGLPQAIAQKAPAYLVNPSHQIPNDVREHAFMICEQIQFIKQCLPWQYSYQEFCDQCPELKLVLDAYLDAQQLTPLLGDDYTEESGWIWNVGALNTWNLDAIYGQYFYEANFDSYKDDLRIYMETKYLEEMNLVFSSQIKAMESMAVRCQKELNAMRSSLQLAMNFSKLEQVQSEKSRERQKKRNEIPNSDSESST